MGQQGSGVEMTAWKSPAHADTLSLGISSQEDFCYSLQACSLPGRLSYLGIRVIFLTCSKQEETLNIHTIYKVPSL